ncbi:MAG: flagellar filament capping protein FliD [Spirochaetota bacterium]
MSDISSIPGVGTSKYGTDKLIEGLMKVERVPRDRAQTQLDTFTKQKSVWTDLGRTVSAVRDSARTMYSFRNPFADRIAKSSEEDVLTATATREALEQTRKVQVEKVATADRFISANEPKDFKVPAGSYGFSVGEKKIDLNYAGGSLQEFADALARKGRDLISAQVVGVTSDTKALVIESLKTGEKNRLGFSGDSEKFAIDIGMVERVTTRSQNLDPAHPGIWSQPISTQAVRASGGSLALSLGGEVKLDLGSPTATNGMSLEIRYKLVKPPDPPSPVAPPGPSIPASGSVTFAGITIKGAPSEAGLPEWTPPPTPPRIDDSQMLYALAPNGGEVAMEALADSNEPRTLKIELSSLLPEIAAIGLRNRDTSRQLEVLSARVFDPKESGGFRPTHPVATAGDALIKVDGIEATRDSNEVKDIIPGVTINLKDASDKVVKLTVEPDRKAAKEAIIALVGNYNKLMAWTNILSRADPTVVAQIDYFTEAEKKTATERLGLYQGDSTLSVLRSSLQRAVSSPFPTRAGAEISLLSQIGISTDSRKPGSNQGVDSARLKGYLEIDEETLDKTLASNFQAVKEIFGNATNGDLIVNTGAAFTLESIARPYVETGGIFSVKNQTLDSQISSQKRTISSLDDSLTAKERALKTKYGMMEGALNGMNSTSASISQGIGSGN